MLELADFGGEKLNRTATVSADHMVMASAVVLMFEASNSIVKRNFAGQAAFGQQLKRSIDGRVSDAGVFLLDQAVKFVGG